MKIIPLMSAVSPPLSHSPTQVSFSLTESSLLGLKVGRCNCDYFDAEQLYRQIVENDYDLCRLKVPAEDEMAPHRLNLTGLPNFFSGSIRKYKTKISGRPSGNYNFPDLAFEMYDGTQDKLLKDMLIGTWGTYPLGYYHTPYLNHLVTKEKEIEAVFQYYKKFNLNKDYPSNSILFIRHGKFYLGFFALNIVGNNLESHIGGILEPYRKEGYFLDMLRYIKEFCVEHGLEHFIFGARNENSEVQRIFQFVGFQAIGSDNVFHIPSLLTYSKREPIEKKIRIVSEDSKEIYRQLFAEASGIGDNLLSGNNKISFHLNNANPLRKEKSLKLRFSFPITTDDELLIVLKSGDIAATPLTGYFRAYK